MALGDPFDLDGDGDLGVVCVHGFTGTPYELRYLGQALGRAGIAVHAPLLPGHGTSLDELARTSWRDWVDGVEAAFDRMRTKCKRVAVVGQSLGGLLSLHLATRRPEVAAVASLAAPLWVDGLAGRVMAWAESLVERGAEPPFSRFPKLGGSDVRDRRVRRENPCYDGFPVRALGQLGAFMKVADEALPRITQPVLVLHARHDHTAPVACAARIAERTRAVRTRILPRSYHLIAADVERDVVAAEVITFLRKHATAAPGDLACAM